MFFQIVEWAGRQALTGRLEWGVMPTVPFNCNSYIINPIVAWPSSNKRFRDYAQHFSNYFIGSRTIINVCMDVRNLKYNLYSLRSGTVLNE